MRKRLSCSKLVVISRKVIVALDPPFIDSLWVRMIGPPEVSRELSVRVELVVIPHWPVLPQAL